MLKLRLRLNLNLNPKLNLNRIRLCGQDFDVAGVDVMRVSFSCIASSPLLFFTWVDGCPSMVRYMLRVAVYTSNYPCSPSLGAYRSLTQVSITQSRIHAVHKAIEP